ncbi:tyrosine--tRNA ligase [Candidatus Roizmanbacteria bacterium RIFCSPHIGHO2_01_FULL_35_10]|uniref:tyrosine--tRNA ligase n=1 Tax=Candidatus Roizmanbacteria bacterium RIFCSPLOWO2_01_FULL_35_13 TaxID=1802055 RepID=A0A1F7I799_9BACT|nr:MAG: tyrosine--tRNA ligase [Candidatus Roizmanbacteria bacterium RIFCSPHIGHO2_01_FULL_35_10]OGK39249.1 MAG: tyrosine--tRNA ligase [Candidatus Roizmanbacteria bacterium RIFCSPLOWO2_01_FULL_35_13]
MTNLNIEERLNLIKQVGEEIIQEDELKKLLESNETLYAYDGFEPSGQIHIAQGIVRAINVNKMTKAGIKFRMWVADWHAMANNKLGGDLEKIKTTGKYFIEVWKASGMDLTNVEFKWASDMVKNSDYWKLVLNIGKSNALKRFIRTAEMMGRQESLDSLTGAHIIYSCMQVADIFMLGAKITQLGMDQRKVNMLAREIGPLLGYWKPVVVSHHMLMGLQNIKNQNNETVKQSNNDTSRAAERLLSSSMDPKAASIKRAIERKMSKSLPDSAIFMTDTTDDIKRKINKAYCPEGIVEENPILEYYKYILFESLDKLQLQNIVLTRPQKFGGPVILNSYENLERLFKEKQIHPLDIKSKAIELLDKLLQPVRRHFEENSEAKKLLEQVKSFQITR